MQRAVHLRRANTPRSAAVVALAGLAIVGAGPSASSATAAFRAFSEASPWNVPAAAKGPIDPGNPFASRFAGSRGFTMKLSGTPDNPTYASPVFFASPGDPATANLDLTTDWSPQRDLKWNGAAVPIPSGTYPAPGSDGHLTIVSADRRTAWEFWRATRVGPGGITAAVIVQWDLTGLGYSANRDENSARGSGTPLISTTLRADEALAGIDHALGITVPSVGGEPVFPPASHTDGDGGAGSIQYGMLFALRPDYAPAPGASVGVRNVVQALKSYGAYVIDQGADLEMDADSTHPELWRQAGLSEGSFDFTATDFRLVRAGPVPFAKQPPRQSLKRRKRRLVLRSNTRSVWAGGQVRLRGEARGGAPAGAHVRIRVRSRGGWHRLRRKPLEADGSFQTNPRLARLATASRRGSGGRLALKGVRLPRGIRVLAIQAAVKGVGRSNVVRIRVRR
jgi:hypothetical protein